MKLVKKINDEEKINGSYHGAVLVTITAHMMSLSVSSKNSFIILFHWLFSVLLVHRSYGGHLAVTNQPIKALAADYGLQRGLKILLPRKLKKRDLYVLFRGGKSRLFF